MQPTYATLINELLQEYRTKRANLRYATAIAPELRQWLTNDYAYRLSIELEEALDDAYATGDIDSAKQIDSVIRLFYTGQGAANAA
ncbi:hypothetical protein [Candidatus Symbiopectobacterium sp. PLON1]|uniref:hypothetical protein n=1 Tax=Candidatus Symbiopectobacterium sp. PLON1 TaxID=2794575 RepID=UPI0025C66676|nr:hypothetical protein [Candidatus Symbiopectobacterium sp. PLON1]